MFDKEGFIKELKEATLLAQPYEGGPAVHYGTILNAYALNISLFRSPTKNILDNLDKTEVLIVQRGNGDGIIGSWSGVSGYIDRPDLHDPIGYTFFQELKEEVGIDETVAKTFTPLYGERFSHGRAHMEGSINVLPIAVLLKEIPLIIIDGKEITDWKWINVQKALNNEYCGVQFSTGYLKYTLPNALKGFR